MPYGSAPVTQNQQTMQYGAAPANAGYGGEFSRSFLPA